MSTEEGEIVDDMRGNPKKVPRKQFSNENSSLTLKGNAEYGCVAADEEKVIGVMASITSIETEDNEDRPPLELVVVLDKSGSMSGAKLSLCKETLKFLVNELGPNDKLGLLAFDSNVEERFKLKSMDQEGKEFAETNIGNIHAGSMTNLSGGLISGIEWLITSGKQSPGQVVTRSVMLLTDGLMNEGIKDASALGRIIEKTLNEHPSIPISIHAFGYGTDADLAACKSISESGNGMFYNIANIDQVSGAFANCLGGLLAVTAQNIQLTFTPYDDCEVQGDPCTKFKFVKTDDKITVKIPDLYSEETKDILFLVKLKKKKDATMAVPAVSEIGQFSIEYLDVVHEKLNSAETFVVIQRPLIVLNEEKNTQVTENRIRIQALEAMEQAKVMADHGNVEEAREYLAGASGFLADQGYSEKTPTVMGMLFNNITEATAAMSNRAEYRLKGAAKLQTYSQQHRFQRSADVYIDRSENVGAAAPANFYMNKKKAGMMSKAASMFSPSSPKQSNGVSPPSSPKVVADNTGSKPAPAIESEKGKRKMSGYFASFLPSFSSSS